MLRRAAMALRGSLWLLVPLALVAVVAGRRVMVPVRVEVARVDRGEIVAEAFGRGTVEPQREAAVGFDLVGRLSEVLVDEGDRVVRGQELARLETSQAQADLRTARTGISAARASLQRLAAEEERGRALLATAERESTRVQGLVRSGAVATQQHDEAMDRLRLARVELDRVLAQRAEAMRGIDVAAGGAEQRRVAMVRATLLAPFDGLVTRRLREPGDTVTVGSTVLRIADVQRVVVRAAVDETVLPQLALDQSASITFPGPGGAVPGRVSLIPWEADRQSHELLVEVTPDGLVRRVAIGQRADVRIEIARRPGVLRVPTAMLHQDAAGAFVYTDQGGRIVVRRPRLGLSGTTHVEVLGGLAAGDPVLAAPGVGATLSPGRRWAPR